MAKPAIIRKIPNTRNPWVATVNGKTYTYEAGTEQEVPEEIAHLIDQEMEHLKPKHPQQSGGGGMLVTVTRNDDGTFTPDKTFQEAINAVAAGVDMRFVIQQEGNGNRTFPFLTNAYIGDEFGQEIWVFNAWSYEQYLWTERGFEIQGGEE